MVGLISSVLEEGKILVDRIRKKTTLSGRTLYRGTIGLRETAYIISGMGKTNAAHAATILIEEFSPDIIILFGIGGAYPSAGLETGDVAVAEKEVYGDEGVQTGDGFHGTEFVGIPLLRKGRKTFFNEFLLDKRLLKRALKIGGRIAPIKSGTFITTSTCTGTRRRAVELKKKYHAICENMEGAAVAQICVLYGVPMLEIRGISNIVEDRDRAKWNIPLAAENCQNAVMEILKTV